MRLVIMLTALLAVVVSACADGGQGGGRNIATEPPGGGTEGAPVEGDSITGKLGGDAELEGGCAWVDDGKTRWEVQYPDGYKVTFDPVTLTGPDGETAREGDTITVAGTPQQDVMTICQVGPVWLAQSVTIEK